MSICLIKDMKGKYSFRNKKKILRLPLLVEALMTMESFYISSPKRVRNRDGRGPRTDSKSVIKTCIGLRY